MGRAEDLMKRVEDRGLDYVNELIDGEAGEEYFLDFKRSSNTGTVCIWIPQTGKHWAGQFQRFPIPTVGS